MQNNQTIGIPTMNFPDMSFPAMEFQPMELQMIDFDLNIEESAQENIDSVEDPQQNIIETYN